jgi:hypothetical protein
MPGVMDLYFVPPWTAGLRTAELRVGCSVLGWEPCRDEVSAEDWRGPGGRVRTLRVPQDGLGGVAAQQNAPCVGRRWGAWSINHAAPAHEG